jgi:hypothetical protein
MKRKDLIRQYKETPRQAGVYRVRHEPSGRTLLGSSPDVQARLNRVRAELRMGRHPIPVLQRDWDADGPRAFSFEILDASADEERSDRERAGELRVLQELWEEKLALSPEQRY